MEANTLPLMTDLVRAGVGYTVLPASGVQHLLKQNQVSATPVKDFSITWLAARPKNRSIGLAALRFYDMLREIGQQMIKEGALRPA